MHHVGELCQEVDHCLFLSSACRSHSHVSVPWLGSAMRTMFFSSTNGHPAHLTPTFYSSSILSSVLAAFATCWVQKGSLEHLHPSGWQQPSPGSLLAKEQSRGLVFAVAGEFNYSSHRNCHLAACSHEAFDIACRGVSCNPLLGL